MTDGWPKRVYVALIHYPVMDKNGEAIASAVTNLDLHDIARACETYGTAGYYVVTPLADQQELVRQILDHWRIGKGGSYNPLRQKALEQVRLKSDVAGAVAEITAIHGGPPRTVATTARRKDGAIPVGQLQEMIRTDPAPVMLFFGTAWGLSDDLMDAADHILEPLMETGDYNHLSVRSAAAIVLDRLLGR
ncbi:RNA methyltransferase [Desulfosarcina sp. OttesenSCG-928-A07]|nr:RNA methyltransferase [Desulfosarcina sp. OttesenSCG-928-G17]MDL2329357.1 RNA methyltransferase [Desulfosarcina sp. OttesenSCG-928-A07]